MERRFEFTGTGGALLGKFIVGTILTGITFGIYAPWFIVNLQKYICEHLALKTEGGDVKFEFTGTGGKLFGTYLVGVLLTGITFGIYASWFIVNLTKYFTDNTVGKTADGNTYAVSFRGNGGSLFGTIFVGYLLTMLTFGIYAAWFMVKLTKFFADNMDIMENGNKVGSFSFNGEGGELFGTYILGVILTGITFGVYASWFMVNLMKYFNNHTQISLNDKSYTADFDGTGGKYFVVNFVGYLLTMITFGIYGAWYMCNLLKFQYENTRILDKA
ncbi:MAG: DUF898 family protein [Deltaproteobacteria bacterium]|nr:DUF898 family protein [Deltaproteobacteria bacterium]MBN2670899.1 DUF898 family protein [Deltaproteobacteria bacterium]